MSPEDTITPCVVCKEDTREWCAECREAHCEDHLMMDGLCPDCSADWEDEDGEWDA